MKMNYNTFGYFYTVYSYTFAGYKEQVRFDPYGGFLEMVNFNFQPTFDTMH